MQLRMTFKHPEAQSCSQGMATHVIPGCHLEVLMQHWCVLQIHTPFSNARCFSAFVLSWLSPASFCLSSTVMYMEPEPHHPARSAVTVQP